VSHQTSLATSRASLVVRVDKDGGISTSATVTVDSFSATSLSSSQSGIKAVIEDVSPTEFGDNTTTSQRTGIWKEGSTGSADGRGTTNEANDIALTIASRNNFESEDPDLVKEELKLTGDVPLSVYIMYLRACGGLIALVLVAFLCVWRSATW